MTQATPVLDGVLAELRGLKFLHDPAVGLRREHGETYDAVAERHLARLARHLAARGGSISDGVEAFVEMTFDVMKMQQEYYETGRFSMDIHGSDLYGDEDLMGRRYLTGLYLAQVLWPNHYHKMAFFGRAMVGRLTESPKVLDVGCGPGTYGLAIGRAMECAELVLLDISPLSGPLVSGLAAADPVRNPDHVRFVAGDFLDRSLVTGPYDAVVFSEIVEHLEDPDAGMRRLRDVLTRDGLAFFSTATNSAFYDHTIVFSDRAEIVTLLARHEFEVVEAFEMVAMPGPEGEGRDVVDYSAVIRPAP